MFLRKPGCLKGKPCVLGSNHLSSVSFFLIFFSSDNAKQWASELAKTLNRDEKYTLVTYQVTSTVVVTYF